MTIFVGNTKYEIDENKILGSGGEATVFPLDNTTAVKIYKIPDKFKESKIKHMLSMSVDNTLRSFAAWPREIVTDIRGRFIGFSMNRINGKETFKSLILDNLSVENRIKLAYNICALTENLHRFGVVIGDLNPGNFIIHNENQLTAIDTDSFHIITSTYEYRCVVGCKELIPAELQEKWQKYTVLTPPCPLPTFTKYTDYFSMAVIVYWLIVNSYPFSTACNPNLSSSAKFITDNELIKKRIFPPVNGGSKYKPQKGSVQFDLLPDDVQDAFCRTFVNGADQPKQRVTAAEWMMILESMLNNAAKCSANSDHLKYKRGDCPYCRAEQELMAINYAINQNMIKINTLPLPVNNSPANASYVNNQIPSYNNTVTNNPKQQKLSLHKTAPYLAYCILTAVIIPVIMSAVIMSTKDNQGVFDYLPGLMICAIIVNLFFYFKTKTTYEVYGGKKPWLFVVPAVTAVFSPQIMPLMTTVGIAIILIGLFVLWVFYS